MDALGATLTALRQAIFVDGDQQSEVIAQLAQEMYTTQLLSGLVSVMEKVDFECRKDIVLIFNKMVRRELGPSMPTVDHIAQQPRILHTLCAGYKNPDIALSMGSMLRECVRFEPLAKIILNDEGLFRDFFVYVQDPQFDIQADAFATFKEMLTKHKILSAEFLEKNYERVFTSYRQLLDSDNYVTRRQSLKLLGELLLDRANFTVMTMYISNPENLKLVMNMLRDKSPHIQFEAFHVFKVFVANPKKGKPVMDILLKNKQKLLTFLEVFHNDREDDQFSDEKKYLIKQIKELKR